MIDKEFDKFFSKKLNEEQQFPFDEREWEKLSDRLEAQDRLKASEGRTNRKWLWLLPLLILLLIGNIGFLTKMNDFQKQNTKLVQQLDNIKNLLQNHDTFVKTQVQFIRDTTIIYKYLPYTNFKNIAQAPTSFTEKNPVVSSNENVDKPIFNSDNLNNNPRQPDEKLDAKWQAEINELKQHINDLTALLEKTQANATDLNKIRSEKDSLNKALALLVDYKKLEETKKKEETPIIQKNEKSAKQNRFFIGLNGGLIYYKSKWLNKDNIELSRNEQSWQIGMKAEYALNDRWRVMAGADYCPFDIHITWSDNRYNLAVTPLDMYPANKFAHKYTAAHQKYLQGFLGVKHIFAGKNWRPYIGLAHTTMRILPFETEFQFQYLWSTNGYTVYKQTPGKTITNLMMLNGGWEWQVTRRIYFLTEGYYYKDMHKTKQTFDQYGLRSALIFGF